MYVYLFVCSKSPIELIGKRVILFSYGSGLAASMYSVRVTGTTSPDSRLMKAVSHLQGIHGRLASRKVVPPTMFENIMKLREDTHHKASYQPVGDCGDLFPGTFFLTSVDEKYRRSYSTTACEGQRDKSAQLLTTCSNGVH